MIRAAIDDLDGSAYVSTLYDATSALVHVAYRSTADLLALGTSFDVPPAWALEKVKSAAQNIGSLVDERDRDALTTILENVLSEGLSARDAAVQLHDAFDTIRSTSDTGAVREMPSDSWFQMVARTELQRAAVNGQLALYETAGIKKLRWQAADPCDICATYDDHVFLTDDLPDDEPGSVHPNCCCVWVPADEDLGDWRGTEADRAAAQSGNQPDDGE